MLTITNSQMSAFQQAHIDDFRRRLFEHLKALQHKAGLNLDDRLFHDAIGEGMDQCRRFRLTREVDVVRYLEIRSIAFNGIADTELPVEALQILLTYGIDPSLKLDQFRAWAEKAKMAKTDGSDNAESI